MVTNGNGHNGNGNGGKTGRPTKLTPEVQAAIVTAISVGNYLHHAAMYAGVSYHAVNYWCKRGEKETTGMFRDFLDAVKKAEGDAIARNVAIIQKAAKKSWQAAAWWLERKYSEDFALKTKQELTGKDGGPVAIQVIVSSPKAKELTEQILAGKGTG